MERTEQHRNPRRGRLAEILPAAPLKQTATHESQRAVPVKQAQVAQGVEQQDRLRRRRSGARLQRGGLDVQQFFAPQQFFDFAPRVPDGAERAPAAARQTARAVRDMPSSTCSSSPGAVEPAISVAPPAANRRSAGSRLGVAAAVHGTELGVAGDDDSARAARPAPGSDRRRSGSAPHQIGAAQGRRPQRTHQAIALERAQRHPSVDQCHAARPRGATR